MTELLNEKQHFGKEKDGLLKKHFLLLRKNYTERLYFSILPLSVSTFLG